MVVAFALPEFLPRSPFWHVVMKAHRLVLLTRVPFARSGQMHRFFHGGRWYSIPVRMGAGATLLSAKYLDPGPSWETIVRGNPAHAKLLNGWTRYVNTSVVDTNVRIIKDVVRRWRISAQVFEDRTSLTSKGVDRMIDLCRRVDGTTVIFPADVEIFMSEKQRAKYRNAGINVKFDDPILAKNRMSLLELDDARKAVRASLATM